MSETQTVEARAQEMGWQPKEVFKGDPDKWIPAEDYVQRGETLMPILKANNRKLLSEVSSLKNEQAQLKTLLQQSQENINTLMEISTAATRKEAKETKTQLLTAIEIARKEGDIDKTVALQTQLDEHTAALDKAVEKGKPAATAKAPPVDPMQDPAFKAFVDENPWWTQEPRKRRMAIVVGQEIKADNPTLTGKAYFDEVAKRTLQEFDDGSSRRPSKVEGGARPNGGSGGDGGAGSGKTYADLPADAKAAADRMAPKAKVGQPGSIFKDMAAYRAHYAAIYWKE